jgi:hypothetical protein
MNIKEGGASTWLLWTTEQSRNCTICIAASMVTAQLQK